MHITTQLDLDVVAVEGDDQVSLLVELTAPTATAGKAHSPRTLVVVLDRSGSMDGPRLEGAKRALDDLVDRLDPADRFGLITFDTEVRVEVAAAPLANKAAAKSRIAHIMSGGATDLSAGLFRGLQEAARAAGPSGATVLLISDGHANAGVVDPDKLRAVAARSHQKGITTTTLGFGLGYDERLLSAVAAGGNGSELFAEHADDAVAAISRELDGLLAQTAQAASLHVRMTPACKRLLVVNDMPSTRTPDGVLIELGAFHSGEKRRLVITFDVPGIPALGLAQVATLEFTWVELPALRQHTVTVPVHVNVLPGDQAAGRIPDAEVRTELAFLRTQQVKREAADSLSRGDVAGGLARLRSAQQLLFEASPAAPATMAHDLDDDLGILTAMIEDTRGGHANRAAKRLSADTTTKSRRRGTGRPA